MPSNLRLFVKREKIRRQPMIDRRLPIGRWQRPPLRVGDRHKRHLVEFAQERLEVGRMHQAVQRCHVGAAVAPQDREVEKVAMEMENIKAVSVAENKLHEPDVMGQASRGQCGSRQSACGQPATSRAESCESPLAKSVTS